MVMITMKHHRKVIAFFDYFSSTLRKNGRIAIKKIQRMLGLMIWVSTVFRITRQFITSTCDIIRVANSSGMKFLFPRKEQALVARFLFDLKFWKRFVSNSPQSSFDFLLGRLPTNKHQLFSDASTSYGMAGVLMVKGDVERELGADGLFWQLSWSEWNKVSDIISGTAKINTAEFLAALITCETFAKYCSQLYTTLGLDNYAAKCWLDAARCPIHPFDRCAQGTHLYMLEMSMKIKTRWIPSAENILADKFSREYFGMSPKIHWVSGVRMRKVRPSWRNVLRFC